MSDLNAMSQLLKELEELRQQRAALEVDHKSALEAANLRLQTLEALKFTSVHLTGAMDLRGVLRSILDVIFKLIPANDAHIFLYQEGKLTFGTGPAGSAHSDKPYSEPRQDGLTYTVARSGQLLVIEDTNTHPIFATYTGTVPKGSMLGIPLKSGDQVVGVMNISFSKVRSFSQGELDTVELFALQAAIAIENARLYQAATHRLQTLDALKFTSLHLTRSMELRGILDAVGSVLFKLIDINDIQIFLYDGENLSFGASLRDGKLFDRPFAEPRREGTTYQVAQSGETYMIEDLKSHPNYAQYAHAKSTFWSGAMISAPLKIGDKVVGVMNVGFEGVRSFDQDERDIVELFAMQAAIAIENARVYAQTQDYANQMEELRNQDRRYYEELNRTKDQLMSMASHDLKNPIASMQTTLYLLEKHGQVNDEKGKRYLERLRHGTGRMLNLVTDLLDIARLETGLDLVPEEVILQDLLKGCLLDFEALAGEKQITLNLSIPDTPCQFMADNNRMQQVLDNLLSNAIKYTPAGGTVELQGEKSNGSVFIRVKDSVLGIPAEDINHLFDKFYRIQRDGHLQVEGTGLGLSIVKTIIEQHGGQIDIESELGLGSVFIISLPCMEN